MGADVDAFAALDAMVAEHEAGHTVVAHALGLEILETSVRGQSTRCGPNFASTVFGDAVTLENAVRGAVLALAGKICETLDLLYDDDDTPEVPLQEGQGGDVLDGNLDDVEEAYRFARVLCADESARHAIISSLMRWTRAVLRRNAAPVKAITAELLKQDLLLSEDSRRIWLASGGKTEPDSLVVEILGELRELGLLSTRWISLPLSSLSPLDVSSSLVAYDVIGGEAPARRVPRGAAGTPAPCSPSPARVLSFERVETAIALEMRPGSYAILLAGEAPSCRAGTARAGRSLSSVTPKRVPCGIDFSVWEMLVGVVIDAGERRHVRSRMRTRCLPCPRSGDRRGELESDHLAGDLRVARRRLVTAAGRALPGARRDRVRPVGLP